MVRKKLAANFLRLTRILSFSKDTKIYQYLFVNFVVFIHQRYDYLPQNLKIKRYFNMSADVLAVYKPSLFFSNNLF